MRNIIIAMMNKKVIFVIGCCLLLMGCNQYINAQTYDNVTPEERNGEITGKEKDAIVGEVSDTIYKQIDRTALLDEPIVNEVIERSGAEVQVPEGRYSIFAGQSGNVLIHDADGRLLTKGTFDQFYGIDILLVDLTEEHTIFFDGGLDGATIMDAIEPEPNTLNAGIWEVGRDIAPGTYTFSTGSIIGYVQVFEKGKDVRVFELLGGEETKSTSVIELTEGQKLKLTNANSFHYEESKGYNGE